MIGRQRERERLERCEASEKSELVCVYGRRRVGKTFLVEQSLSPYFAFHVVGSKDASTANQLREFGLELADRGDADPEPPRDWREAFNRMYKVATAPDAPKSPHGKTVIFIDEFPWFARQRSDFLSAFSAFWNRRSSSGQKLMVVICGSATSWIIENMLDTSGDLAARVTESVFLEPFSLAETKAYFDDRGFGWDEQTLIETQMVFGGLPFFFSLMHSHASLWENIDRLCLGPRAQLRSETMILLESTMRKSRVYADLFMLLSKYKYGVPKRDLANRLGYSASQVNKAVDEAVKCGYVFQYRNNGAAGHPKYLMLIDPFILFHYRFIAPPQGEAPRSWTDFVSDQGRFHAWRGNAFEIVCLYHVRQLKAALGISGVETSEYPWASMRKEGGAQIDLVIERADKVTNLCEMKFTDEPFELTRQVDREFARKRDVFRDETGTKHALKPVLVSVNGTCGYHDSAIAWKMSAIDLFREPFQHGRGRCSPSRLLERAD